ncbi:hypothetical protein [Azospirillum sp. SYSU D00513]|uniref:hypothetical protein n=1 Tax=Azospirillum sp. SYSU D00513 TaxID=2812561 RepID=UPI001A97803F|nr:hypothetical protein [Azospirillum sp. SYSU D00513]
MRADGRDIDGTGNEAGGEPALMPDREMYRDALERERWYRGIIERDRELLLALGPVLGTPPSRERAAMRFWRWLIDDFRSERREWAARLDGQLREGLLPALLPWLGVWAASVRARFGRLRLDRVRLDRVRLDWFRFAGPRRAPARKRRRRDKKR